MQIRIRLCITDESKNSKRRCPFQESYKLSSSTLVNGQFRPLDSDICETFWHQLPRSVDLPNAYHFDINVLEERGHGVFRVNVNISRSPHEALVPEKVLVESYGEIIYQFLNAVLEFAQLVISFASGLGFLHISSSDELLSDSEKWLKHPVFCRLWFRSALLNIDLGVNKLLGVRKQFQQMEPSRDTSHPLSRCHKIQRLFPSPSWSCSLLMSIHCFDCQKGGGRETSQ